MSDGVEQRPGEALPSRPSAVTFESHLCCGWARGWGGGWEGVVESRGPPDHWPWKAGGGRRAAGSGRRAGWRTETFCARRPLPPVWSRAQAAAGVAGEVAAGPLSRQPRPPARGFSTLGRRTMGQCEGAWEQPGRQGPCGPMLRGEDGAVAMSHPVQHPARFPDGAGAPRSATHPAGGLLRPPTSGLLSASSWSSLVLPPAGPVSVPLTP